MKDLTSLQTKILEYLLQHRAADANEIARNLKGVNEKQVAKEIRRLIANGWLEPRLRVMEDKLVILGYPVKIRVDLWLNTAAAGRKERFPSAHSPQALAKAVAEEFQKEQGDHILLGQVYAALGGRLDAVFSFRCKGAIIEKNVQHCLEQIPGVERAYVYRLLLIEE